MKVALAISSLAMLCGVASADNTASINLTGVQLRNATPQTRSSNPDAIDPSCFYEYRVSGMVRGRGGTFAILQVLFPNPTPIEQVLEQLAPGSSAFLNGAVASTNGGQHPIVLFQQVLEGDQTILGIPIHVSATIVVGIDANNFTYFNIVNPVVTPSATVGYLEFTSGTASVTGQGACRADFNGDCFVDFFDLDAFIECFEGGACPPGKSADFNNDGFVDFFDADDFVQAYEVGC